MILGDPTLQSVLDLIESDGCPRYGELLGEIRVHVPNKIVLMCDHIVDAETWIKTNG